MRTLITNGTVVTAEGSQAADVLIDGERIVGIGGGLARRAIFNLKLPMKKRYDEVRLCEQHIAAAMRDTVDILITTHVRRA